MKQYRVNEKCYTEKSTEKENFAVAQVGLEPTIFLDRNTEILFCMLRPCMFYRIRMSVSGNSCAHVRSKGFIHAPFHLWLGSSDGRAVD